MHNTKAYFWGGLFVFSLLATLFGCIVSFVGVSNLDEYSFRILPGVIFVAALTLLFAATTMYSWKSRKRVIKSGQDNQIYEAAIKQNGMITAIELATAINISIPDAQQRLDEHFFTGLCEKKLTDNMVAVYHYTNALSEKEKASAIDIAEVR